MTINTGTNNPDTGVMRMPKAQVAEGQKHGYIGEEEGLVETYDAPKAGNTNVAPDVKTAEANLKAAQRAVKDAERDLAHAKEAKAENLVKQADGTTAQPKAKGDQTPMVDTEPKPVGNEPDKE